MLNCMIFAFDRLCYDKLFNVFLDRGMPPVIVRSMLDMYGVQKLRTTWQGCHSEYFNVSNGIQQGGIISPLLYSVYTDILLRKLKDSGIGCYIGHMYVGGMAYADKIR